MVYINKLILGTSVCVCFCNWFCVSVCACVYHGPCFLWRKETVKPTWKFIRAVSGAQSIHLKTLLLCWVECPEIFRAVLTTILSFHVVSDTIFGSCESFAPCGWLRICIYLIPALISRPFGEAIMDGVATESSAGQAESVSELRGEVLNVMQWLLRCPWCRFKCWSLTDTWPTSCNALLKK